MWQRERREHDQHAAEGVRVDGSADGTHRVGRIILDVTQRAEAARIVEARQPVQHGHSPFLRDDIEHDADQRRPGPGQDQHLACPLQILLLAHDVDDHEKEQHPADDLGEAADGGDAGAGVGGAQRKCEQRKEQKDCHRQSHRRAGETPLASGHQTDAPDQHKRSQRGVEKGRFEADANWEGGKWQQRRHQNHEDQPPARAAQSEIASGQSQSRADSIHRTRDRNEQRDGQRGQQQRGHQSRLGNAPVRIENQPLIAGYQVRNHRLLICVAWSGSAQPAPKAT